MINNMAKLGSKKRPAIVRVNDMRRAAEMMSICREHGWEAIVGVEPDKDEDISDVERLLNPPRPISISQPKIGRNDPCACNSGKKYKKCCFV
jgi:SWIM/SEC-C metal-binding protein